MKINKTFRDEEIHVGDIFHFDYKKIMDTPFCNSYFGKDLAEKNADEAYIQVNIDPKNKLNVPSYKIYYVKDEEIIYQGFQNEAVFFSYIMGKEKEGVLNKVGHSLDIDVDVKTLLSREEIINVTNPNESITDKNLNIKTANGDYINYGDVVKIDYILLKEKQNGGDKIIADSFMEKLDKFNVDELYFHITDIRNDYNHCFSSPKIYIYAKSEDSLSNGKTAEENANTLDYFKESNQLDRKLDTYFTYVDGGNNILEKFSQKDLFERITNNIINVNLKLGDIIYRSPVRRIKP